MLPFALFLLAVAASAFGQEPLALPLPAAPEHFRDLPQWMIATLATGTLGAILKAGGIPLQVTHVVSEPDRELLRAVRDRLAEIARR